MSKNGKNTKIKNFSAKSAEDKNSFSEAVRKIVENLYYVSETDAEIFPYVGVRADSVSAEVLASQTQIFNAQEVKEISFVNFFSPLIEIQDWYEEEEKRAAHKFLELKDLLQKNLRDLKVFKIGRIEIDVYVVGLNEQSLLIGIMTKAIET